MSILTFLTPVRFADTHDVIGYTEQILCKGIPVPQINCEIAIPLQNFEKATKKLHEWNEKNPNKLHYPFIYRVTGESKAWLSATFPGPTVWIGGVVDIFISVDNTFELYQNSYEKNEKFHFKTIAFQFLNFH